jgi:hypothetical protein
VAAVPEWEPNQIGPQPVIVWLNNVTPRPVSGSGRGRIAAGKLSLLDRRSRHRQEHGNHRLGHYTWYGLA